MWAPFALAFLLINITSIDDGGTNANARFATLRAMADEGTFRINNYSDWTMDWARTPDGSYYANKAPGPTLVAFPLFYLIDQALFSLQEKHPDERGRRQAPRGIHKVAISTTFQVIPFLILSLLLVKAAFPLGLKREQYFLCLAAILFGNTAAALMNSYLGNPFAGMTMLGMAYAYLRKWPGWMAFFFGWTVLSEYIAGAILLPFLFLLLADWRELGGKKILTRACLGATLPALLWCWYHYTCFGGILSLPFQFEVTAVVGNVQEKTGSIWGGITALLPSSTWAYELLFGFSRGILVTQPWVLLVLAMTLPIYRSLCCVRMRRLFVFSVASFLAVFWLNAGFPGWHGGGSPGPRYLSVVLPILGLFLPAAWSASGKVLRSGLLVAVIGSIALRGLIYATWILPPPTPLWPYYLAGISGWKEILEILIFFFIMAILLRGYLKLSKEATL